MDSAQTMDSLQTKTPTEVRAHLPGWQTASLDVNLLYHMENWLHDVKITLRAGLDAYGTEKENPRRGG